MMSLTRSLCGDGVKVPVQNDGNQCHNEVLEVSLAMQLGPMAPEGCHWKDLILHNMRKMFIANLLTPMHDQHPQKRHW